MTGQAMEPEAVAKVKALALRVLADQVEKEKKSKPLDVAPDKPSELKVQLKVEASCERLTSGVPRGLWLRSFEGDMAVDRQENRRTPTAVCVLLGVLTVRAQAQNIDTARFFKQDSPAVVRIICQKSGTPIGELMAMLSFKIVGGENFNLGIPVNYVRGMLDTHQSFPLSELAGRIGAGSVKPLSQLAEATPTDISGEWKSLRSGASFRVRLEEGHAYVVRAVTDEQAKLGMFQICDLKGEGDKYQGTCRGQGVASWYGKWHHQWRARRCKFQGRVEFTECGPSRIKGRVEARGVGEEWSDKDKSNCGKRFPMEWQDFVWIRPN